MLQNRTFIRLPPKKDRQKEFPRQFSRVAKPCHHNELRMRDEETRRRKAVLPTSQFPIYIGNVVSLSCGVAWPSPLRSNRGCREWP